jgi:hypothetical protein
MRTVRSLVLLLALLALASFAAGCGDDDKGASSGAKNAKTSSTETDTTDGGGADTASKADETFQIQVKDGEVIGGPQAFKVKSGDSVEIQILSDVADEVHLHGIDEEVKLDAGMPGTIDFTAKDQGSYELEGHETGLVMGTVEVS